MKKQALMGALIGAALMSSNSSFTDSEIEYTRRRGNSRRVKPQMTNKQIKARKKSKQAKKARRKQRSK